MRLGVLGGTFDPIHQGHLDAAEAAAAALSLDRVLFVPAHVPPHRARAPQASAYHRFAMTALAVLGREGFLASDIELTRPGPSYSMSTLQRLHGEGHQPWDLFFITGVDAFAEIATWRDYPALIDASHFVVVTRPGHPASEVRRRLPELATRFLDGPPHAGSAGAQALGAGPTRVIFIEARTSDVSSTEIRRRLADGDGALDLLPGRVAEHIHQHQLYQRSHTAFQLHGQV